MIFESKVILWSTLSIVAVAYVVLLVKFLIERRAYKQWMRSLNKDALLRDEAELKKCLKEAGIQSRDSSIEELIQGQSYKIRETPFLFFREAYTSVKPCKEVVVRKRLSAERRHFALFHELMHIIYTPEELLLEQRNRGIHHIFIRRDDEEQKRDYLAASLILPEDEIWKRLEECSYFKLSKNDQKRIVYSIASDYSIEPSAVIRRICELQVIHN